MSRLSPEILDYYDEEEVVGRIVGKHGYSEREALALFLESKTYGHATTTRTDYSN